MSDPNAEHDIAEAIESKLIAAGLLADDLVTRDRLRRVVGDLLGTITKLADDSAYFAGHEQGHADGHAEGYAKGWRDAENRERGGT